jgi:DNA-binding response OmpR family regulator
MLVLVVEDDPDQLELRSLLLSKAGFEPLPASDSGAALEIARQRQPGCAVVDLGLPLPESGLLLLRTLREIRPGIQLIVLTGRSERSVRDQLQELGVEMTLEKGFSASALVNSLRSMEAEGNRQKPGHPISEPF